MRKLFLIFLFFGCTFRVEAREDLSSIKRQMITDSISSYSGNCACPYNSTANGSSCGKRSAYSKHGGAAPLCYETDITDAQAAEWLRRNKR